MSTHLQCFSGTRLLFRWPGQQRGKTASVSGRGQDRCQGSPWSAGTEQWCPCCCTHGCWGDKDTRLAEKSKVNAPSNTFTFIISAPTDLPSCRPTQMMFPIFAAFWGLSASSSPLLGHVSFTYSRQRTGAFTGMVFTRRGVARFRDKIPTWPWLELPPPPAT